MVALLLSIRESNHVCIWRTIIAFTFPKHLKHACAKRIWLIGLSAQDNKNDLWPNELNRVEVVYRGIWFLFKNLLKLVSTLSICGHEGNHLYSCLKLFVISFSHHYHHHLYAIFFSVEYSFCFFILFRFILVYYFFCVIFIHFVAFLFLRFCL